MSEPREGACLQCLKKIYDTEKIKCLDCKMKCEIGHHKYYEKYSNLIKSMDRRAKYENQTEPETLSYSVRMQEVKRRRLRIIEFVEKMPGLTVNQLKELIIRDTSKIRSDVISLISSGVLKKSKYRREEYRHFINQL